MGDRRACWACETKTERAATRKVVEGGSFHTHRGDGLEGDHFPQTPRVVRTEYVQLFRMSIIPQARGFKKRRVFPVPASPPSPALFLSRTRRSPRNSSIPEAHPTVLVRCPAHPALGTNHDPRNESPGKATCPSLSLSSRRGFQVLGFHPIHPLTHRERSMTQLCLLAG